MINLHRHKLKHWDNFNFHDNRKGPFLNVYVKCRCICRGDIRLTHAFSLCTSSVCIPLARWIYVRPIKSQHIQRIMFVVGFSFWFIWNSPLKSGGSMQCSATLLPLRVCLVWQSTSFSHNTKNTTTTKQNNNKTSIALPMQTIQCKMKIA